MKALVIATKGGVGKSTVSQTVLASYNLYKTGASEIREIDDQNKDAEWLNVSAIASKQIPLFKGKGLDAAFENGEVINKNDEAVVIDVGGNETSKIFIDTLLKYKMNRRYIDAVFIPVIDNRISVKTAESTIALIAEHEDLQCLLSKIVIVINRVSSNIFKYNYKHKPAEHNPVEFENELRARYFNVFKLIDDGNYPWLAVEDFDGAENIAGFGKTIFELGQVAADMEENLEEKIEQLDEQEKTPENLKERVALMRDYANLGKVRRHWSKVNMQYFNELDKILEKLNK